MTTLIDNLMGDGVTGATNLLGGSTGELVVIGVSIAIIGLIVGAIFYFISFAKKR